MKILYITSRLPFPPDGGYAIVVYNSMRGALREGAEVSLFSLNPRKYHKDILTLSDSLADQIPVTVHNVNTDVNLADALKNLFSRESYNVSRYYRPAAAERLKSLLTQNHFDIIQLEGLYVVPYLKTIRDFSDARIVYRAHNIEYRIWEQQAITEKFPLRRFYLNLLAARLRTFETENLNRFDAIITINKADAGHLKHLGCRITMKSFAVAIDPADYIAEREKTEHPSVFHIGSMDWLPNREGIEWFLENVWNNIQDLKTGLQLHIAGKNITDDFEDYEDDDIVFHSDVADAKAFVNSKSVMVVPLRSGSGMRVKIIEGMAMQKCIISTSAGAEGIRYQHADNILIADTPDEFYRYILQCATNRGMVEQIGENARRLIETDHHIDPISKQHMAFYAKLIRP